MAADLEPAEFLENIRDLANQREREDTERLRQLEAQLLQEKEDRKLRRAGVFITS
jgi:hypothetical protein